MWASLATVSLAVLASPISWYHSQVFSIPALAALAASSWRSTGPLTWRPFFWVVLAIVLTRMASWGFGSYVDAYGWTADNPLMLALVTSSVAVLGVLPIAGALTAARGSDLSSAGMS